MSVEADKEAVLKGLPEGIRRVKVFVTNENTHNSERQSAWMRNGHARFLAESNSFITLIADAEGFSRRF